MKIWVWFIALCVDSEIVCEPIGTTHDDRCGYCDKMSIISVYKFHKVVATTNNPLMHEAKYNIQQ